MRMVYYRLINTPNTLFSLFTVYDVLGVLLPFVAFAWLEAWSLIFIGLSGYFAHVWFFRRKKPKGYTAHWIRNRIRPKSFRAGKTEMPLPHDQF